MSSLLEDNGLGRVEHVRQRDAVSAELWDRSDSLRPAGLTQLARATVRPRRYVRPTGRAIAPITPGS